MSEEQKMMDEKKESYEPYQVLVPKLEKIMGCYCIVRTYSAGVHLGFIEGMWETQVKLSDTRRIWRWGGEFPLKQMALTGETNNAKISEKVPQIILTQVIEVIPCTDEAKEKLDRDGQWSV